MSRSGDCYDNAVVESFFATLKAEHVYDEDFPRREVARAPRPTPMRPNRPGPLPRKLLAFHPAIAAVVRGLASGVGHLPARGVPIRLRRPGARVGTEVRTWIIEDRSGEVVREKLSAEERRLPIAVIWNQELLAQRVAEGWRPEMEGSNE